MKKTLFSIIAILSVGIFLSSCGESPSSNNNSKSKNNMYSVITKGSAGDFRNLTLNKSTINDIKKSEDANALYQETSELLEYKYQIDDYNRYDVRIYLSDGILSGIFVDYYSYENDGAKAYQNGKDLYDALMKDFTAKYGEPKEFSAQNFDWKDVKSVNGTDMNVNLANTGKEGSSGTVQLHLKIKE